MITISAVGVYFFKFLINSYFDSMGVGNNDTEIYLAHALCDKNQENYFKKYSVGLVEYGILLRYDYSIF